MSVQLSHCLSGQRGGPISTQNTRDGQTAFVLIHGVGDPADQQLLDASRPSFGRLGIPFANIYEFNWNQTVDHPFESLPKNETDSWMNDVYIARIGSSLLNIATFPFARGRSRYQNALISLCEREALVFQTFPILLFVVPLCLVIPAYGPLRGILASYGVLLTILQLLGIATGRRKTILECVRAALVPILWSLTYVLLIPANINLGAAIGLMVFLIMLALSVWVPVSFQPFSEHFEGLVEITTWNWKSVLYFGAAGGIWFALTIGLQRLIRSTLYLTTKIVADISLYLGDAKYRDALISNFDGLLNSIAETHNSVVIVSHSLGTVIAVDTLRQCSRDRFGDVVFITCGSPLARIFCRFFPAAYPPPELLYRELCSRFHRFRWANLFRPLDPIGASLGLPPGCDISTHQWNRFFLSAHADYWSDSHAFDLASDWIRQPHAPAAQTAQDYQPRFHTSHEKASQRLRRLSLVVTVLAALALPVFGIRSFTRTIPIDTETLLRDSTEVPAMMVYWKTQDQLVEGDEGTDYWEVRYSTKSTAISMQAGLPDVSPEKERAIEAFRAKSADCRVAGHEAKCMSTKVRYANSQPSIFTLPDYELKGKRTTRQPGLGVLFWVLVVLLVPMACIGLYFSFSFFVAPVLFPPVSSLFGFVDRFSFRTNEEAKLRDERATFVPTVRGKDH
jgi:hypothetical protein